MVESLEAEKEGQTDFKEPICFDGGAPLTPWTGQVPVNRRQDTAGPACRLRWHRAGSSVPRPAQHTAFLKIDMDRMRPAVIGIDQLPDLRAAPVHHRARGKANCGRGR